MTSDFYEFFLSGRREAVIITDKDSVLTLNSWKFFRVYEKVSVSVLLTVKLMLPASQDFFTTYSLQTTIVLCAYFKAPVWEI